MIKRTLEELKPYAPPGHFGMAAMMIHGKEETGAKKFRFALSVFLPGGGAEWDKETLEKIYYVLEGSVTVTDKAGKKYVLHKDESLVIVPGDERHLINESNLPAKMLVIAAYPDE
ncbi:MAG: cupin domain-containing protein [Oscillospiraceae bacterium]|nr:cupin domain-containing protein [Oscillospiraceae bacterium]